MNAAFDSRVQWIVVLLCMNSIFMALFVERITNAHKSHVIFFDLQKQTTE